MAVFADLEDILDEQRSPLQFALMVLVDVSWILRTRWIEEEKKGVALSDLSGDNPVAIEGGDLIQFFRQKFAAQVAEHQLQRGLVAIAANFELDAFGRGHSRHGAVVLFDFAFDVCQELLTGFRRAQQTACSFPVVKQLEKKARL